MEKMLDAEKELESFILEQLTMSVCALCALKN